MEIKPEELREVFQRDYATFCCLHQDDGYFDPVHEKLCDFVRTELEKPGDTRILVIMPRGSLKSTIITKYLSAWLAVRDPESRVLVVSNTEPNARRKIEDIRRLFDSHDLFRAVFPDLLPTKDCRWSTDSAEINRKKNFPEATFEAAGIRTRVTSRHYTAILEDDTTAPDEDDLTEELAMPSMEDVSKAIGWHKLASALLVPGVRGQKRIRIVVTTRWSDNDLAAYILENENYAVFNIPALNRETGKPNFVCFYDEDQLKQIESEMGRYMFSALYLNDPIPAGARTFKEEWIHTCGPDLVPRDSSYYVSIDPAISEKEDACETSIIGAFHKRPNIYVSDLFSGRISPSQTVEKALEFVVEHYDQCRGLLVEANAYQKALCYAIRDRMRALRISKPVFEVQSRTHKKIRIEALQPLYEFGHIWHLEGLPKVLRTQLLQYPHGKLVDVIDCLSMHMKVYRGVEVYNKPTFRPPVDEYEEAVKEIKKRKEKSIHGLPTGIGDLALQGNPTGVEGRFHVLGV